MPETPYAKFRLGTGTIADLDALAASNGGNRSAALREAVEQWYAAVEDAGRLNAAELDDENWIRLGHLNDPDPLAGLIDDDDRSHGRDWARWLADELVGMWDGRDLVLPLHKAEAKSCRALAKRVAGWGRVRGYSLMAALRHFWREPTARIQSCALPEVWLTPTAKAQSG